MVFPCFRVVLANCFLNVSLLLDPSRNGGDTHTHPPLLSSGHPKRTDDQRDILVTRRVQIQYHGNSRYINPSMDSAGSSHVTTECRHERKAHCLFVVRWANTMIGRESRRMARRHGNKSPNDVIPIPVVICSCQYTNTLRTVIVVRIWLIRVT